MDFTGKTPETCSGNEFDDLDLDDIDVSFLTIGGYVYFSLNTESNEDEVVFEELRDGGFQA